MLCKGLGKTPEKLNSMFKLGHYIPSASLIHRLDPRLKIVSLIAMSIIILKAGITSGTIITLFILSLVPVSGLKFSDTLRALRPLAIFFAVLFFIHLFFTRGNPVPVFPRALLAVTYEGLYRGLGVVWRFALLVLGAFLLTSTTSPEEMVSGIERLLRPFRFVGIKSHDVALMISIALRFVPTLLEEAQRIKEAQIARGADFGKGSLIRRVRAATRIIPSLIMNALRRAEELAAAMEARGYSGGARTYMRDLQMSRSDYAASLIMIMLIGIHLFHG